MDLEVQEQTVGHQFEVPTLQNKSLKNPKVTFELQNLTFEDCLKPKMTSKDFRDCSPGESQEISGFRRSLKHPL